MAIRRYFVWFWVRVLCCLPTIVLVLFLPVFAEVISYPQIPGRPLSTTYSVMVDGQPVPAHQYNGNSFAWFAFSGTANVKVTVNQSVSSYTLSPSRKQVSTSVSGNEISFTLNKPRKLVLNKVNGLSEQLFILADPTEIDPPMVGQPGVHDVQTYGADPNGVSSSTVAIQHAIDAASAQAGGGVAYIPAGLYNLTGHLVLKSHVQLYLAPGSVIRTVGGIYSRRVAFHVPHVTDGRISGRGVIDGQGSGGDVGYSQMLQTDNARNFQLQDVMFLDSYTTAVRLGMSWDSTIDNVKILSGSPVLSDGIDTDSVSNLTIFNNFIYSSDDNIAIGAGTNLLNYGSAAPTEGIRISGNLFHHPSTGYCCYGHIVSIVPIRGTTHIRDIAFSNNDGIWAKDVFGIFPFGGTNVSKVTYSNSSVEEATGRLFLFLAIDCTSWGPQNCGQPAGVLGHIRDIVVHNVTVGNGLTKSALQGFSPRANVDGVTFSNLRIAGELITDADKGNIDIGEHVSNVRFNGIVDQALPQPPAGLRLN